METLFLSVVSVVLLQQVDSILQILLVSVRLEYVILCASSSPMDSRFCRDDLAVSHVSACDECHKQQIKKMIANDLSVQDIFLMQYRLAL